MLYLTTFNTLIFFVIFLVFSPFEHTFSNICLLFNLSIVILLKIYIYFRNKGVIGISF